METIIQFPMRFVVVWLEELVIEVILTHTPSQTHCHYALINSIIPSSVWNRNCTEELIAKCSTWVWGISLIFNILFWFVIYKLSRSLYRSVTYKIILYHNEEKEGNDDSSMSLPHSLSYIGNIVHGIISQSTKIGQSHPSARRKHSNASSSVSASIDVPLNRCKIVPVEFSGEHITSLVVPNQFIERCESSHEQNGVKRNSLEVYESLTEFGGNNLTPITPILLDRKLTHGEEKELHYQMESKSTSKELLNKSEGDQNIDENEDSSSVWDVKDDNSTYIPTNNSSDASDIKPSLVEPIHPSSMKNLIEEVNYPLTSDDPKLIASYVNGKDDYCDDGPRGFFIKRESQTNTLSSNLSSRQTINESYSKILTDLPSLERRDSRQFYGLSDSDIRDRKPSQLDYLTLNLIQKNYELSCRQCGCMLDCWNSHCVIPSRCCHMLCFTCGRDNLKLPTTEVHHEIMDQLTFEEKRLLFEYEELLQIHNYQPIVRSEHVLIPWNITTYQVPDTEILFGCKFETRCPKVCPICGLLSTKYWEIITPPFC